jgi:hypothetical protein
MPTATAVALRPAPEDDAENALTTAAPDDAVVAKQRCEASRKRIRTSSNSEYVVAPQEGLMLLIGCFRVIGLSRFERLAMKNARMNCETRISTRLKQS